jgi:hypothetical protein
MADKIRRLLGDTSSPDPERDSTPDPTQNPTPDPTQNPTPNPTPDPSPNPSPTPTGANIPLIGIAAAGIIAAVMLGGSDE